MTKSCSTCRYLQNGRICAHPDLLDRHGQARADATVVRTKGPCAEGQMWKRKAKP